MAASSHRIFVAKDGFKFSCAHLTVFPDGRKERLHGHNYFVEVAVDLAEVSFERMIDFGPLKQAVTDVCLDWRERTLLAADNPHFTVVRDADGELEFTLCGQRYVLPREDALLLPVDNTAVEQLAVLVTDRLIERAALPTGLALGIEVTVSESPGQGSTHYRGLAPAE